MVEAEQERDDLKRERDALATALRKVRDNYTKAAEWGNVFLSKEAAFPAKRLAAEIDKALRDVGGSDG